MAITQGNNLEDLSLEQFKSVHSIFESDVYPVLEIDVCIKARQVLDLVRTSHGAIDNAKKSAKDV